MNSAPQKYSNWVAILDLIAALEASSRRGSAMLTQHQTFLLQEICEAPLEFLFFQGTFGPESEDLRDVLDEMEAWRLLHSTPEGLEVTRKGQAFRDKHRKYELKRQLEFLLTRLGSCTLAQTERLGAAFYVSMSGLGDDDVESRAVKLHLLKPHVSVEEARDALAWLDKLRAETKQRFSEPSLTCSAV